MTPEQFEQAKRELLEKHKFGYQEYVDFVESEFDALLEQHKEVILREELIKYEIHWNFVLRDNAEKVVDEYLKNVKK